MGDKPEVGRKYYRIKDGVPRIVEAVEEDGTVLIKAPGGTTLWPVKHFWRTYCETPLKGR